MQQKSCRVTPTHTTYEFEGAGIRLGLEFSYACIHRRSRPALTASHLYLVQRSIDEREFAPCFFADRRRPGNRSRRSEPHGCHVTASDRVARGLIGWLARSERSQPFRRRICGIDWGYFHLAVPKVEYAATAMAPGGEELFVQKGQLPARDEIGLPSSSESLGAASRCGVGLQRGVVPIRSLKHVLVSYTEGYAIQYFERNLRPYWQRNNLPVEQMLDEAESQYAGLEERGARVRCGADNRSCPGRRPDIRRSGDRSPTGRHSPRTSLVADVDGSPLQFPKENFSNGCIATVDVLYPARRRSFSTSNPSSASRLN